VHFYSKLKHKLGPARIYFQRPACLFWGTAHVLHLYYFQPHTR